MGTPEERKLAVLDRLEGQKAVHVGYAVKALLELEAATARVREALMLNRAPTADDMSFMEVALAQVRRKAELVEATDHGIQAVKSL